ncbi:MAG: hypothetical protein GWN58_48970 [Anaerolineae bacterium]|nr:hypothetical protein [Anaerolineae bacterium]
MDVLKTVRTVLGVRGFRAHLLDEATGAIETIANTWLDTMNAPMRIRLGVDSRLNVALEVDGVAGDQGYLGASSGERRRVDVALLLALADLAGSSTSREPGTLFLDEVFDTLDPNGVSGVCEVLDILGESRAAVVITHSDDLQGMVDATKHVAL